MEESLAFLGWAHVRQKGNDGISDSEFAGLRTVSMEQPPGQGLQSDGETRRAFTVCLFVLFSRIALRLFISCIVVRINGGCRYVPGSHPAESEASFSNIGQFIDEVYNAKRLHSSLGYVPPIEFEAAYYQGLGC